MRDKPNFGPEHPDDSEHLADQPERSPEQNLSLARALAKRHVRETHYDYEAIREMHDGTDMPNQTQPILEAMAMGQASTFLKLLENPDAALEAADAEAWVDKSVMSAVLDSYLSQDKEARIAFALPGAPREYMIEKARRQLAKSIGRVMQPGTQANREFRRYEKFLPMCVAVAEAHEVNSEEVLEDDALFAEAVRGTYTPQQFAKEEYDALSPKSREYLASAFSLVEEHLREHDEGSPEEAALRMETRRRRFQAELQAKGPTEAKMVVAHLRQMMRLKTRSRIERIWGEEAIAELPNRYRQWLAD